MTERSGSLQCYNTYINIIQHDLLLLVIIYYCQCYYCLLRSKSKTLLTLMLQQTYNYIKQGDSPTMLTPIFSMNNGFIQILISGFF